MRAYIQIPFQEAPAVMGNVSKNILSKVIDGVVPRNLPSNWSQDTSIRILSAFWVSDTVLAISVTVRGQKDRSNRVNLLSHVVVSDEEAFLLDPISALAKLDAISGDPKVATSVGLEAIMEASKVIVGDEAVLKSLMGRIQAFDPDFLSEALYTPTNADVTYLGYDDKEKLMDYLRALFLTVQPILGTKCSFISVFGTFDNPDPTCAIKCFKTDSKGVHLDNDDKKILKDQKAALIDIPRQRVHEKGKKSKITDLLIEELTKMPWVGMDRVTHLSTLHNILRERVSGQTKTMTPFAEVLLQTVKRLENIERTKID